MQAEFKQQENCYIFRHFSISVDRSYQDRLSMRPSPELTNLFDERTRTLAHPPGCGSYRLPGNRAKGVLEGPTVLDLSVALIRRRDPGVARERGLFEQCSTNFLNTSKASNGVGGVPG